MCYVLLCVCVYIAVCMSVCLGACVYLRERVFACVYLFGTGVRYNIETVLRSACIHGLSPHITASSICL